MKILASLNQGLLLLLGLSTAGLKIAGLWTKKVEFEFVLFYNMGFSHTAVVIFGFVQLLGALLLLSQKTIQLGAIILAITFAIATAALLVSKNIPFGLASLLFIAMAAFCHQKNFFNTSQTTT